MPRRPRTCDDRTTAAELGWWERFGEIEDRFCWVQTPSIQKILRGRYIQKIIDLAAPGGCVAELGCGTGWLSVLLAKMGTTEVVGIDFSPSQIEKARKRAAEAKVDDRATFIVGGAEALATLGVNVCVLHAFLHHLAADEIAAVLTRIHESLSPGGRLVTVEPTLYPGDGGESTPWLRRLGWLRALPNRGRRCGIRRLGGAEEAWRQVLNERSVGVAPFGPSPKEMPFSPGELEELLQERFRIVKVEPCLISSHLVAMELLLMELTHPWVSRALQGPILRWARYCEFRAFESQPPAPGVWWFNMHICERA